MNMQNTILRQYQEIYGKQTLQEVADTTGIQITRVFRLFNGQEMKISEYQKFQKSIENKIFGKNIEFLQAAKNCLLKLKLKSLDEIEEFMDRKLRLFELKANV